MNYQLVYDALIQKAQARGLVDGYSERHHILPKCLGGGNEAANLVDLTAREHCLAHLLLARIHGGKLWYAANMMLSTTRPTSRAYAVVKEQHSKNMSGKNNHMYGIRLTGKLNPMFGRKGESAPGYGKRGNKSPSFGMNKDKNANFKGKLKVTNIKTGEVKFLSGATEIISAGFINSNVSKCLNGKRKSHRGHTFVRLT